MLPAFPVFFSWLPHFRSERDDLGELLVAQLAGYRPEDARSNRLVRIVNQNCRVIVKPDVRSVLASLLFARAHNHTLHYRALLHLAFRQRFNFESGRVEAICTVSPTFASPVSSCA